MSMLTDWINETPERAVAYAREALAVDANEEIWGAMNQLGVRQIDLANRMGRSRNYINTLLKEPRNMTLATLAEIAHALDYEVDLKLVWKKDSSPTTSGHPR